MKEKIYIPLPQGQLKTVIEQRQVNYGLPNRFFPKAAKSDTLIGGTTILGKAWIAGRKGGAEICCRYFEYRIVTQGEGSLIEGRFRFTLLDRIFPFLLVGYLIFFGLYHGVPLGDWRSRTIFLVLLPALIFAWNGILCALYCRTKNEKHREQMVMNFFEELRKRGRLQGPSLQ